MNKACIAFAAAALLAGCASENTEKYEPNWESLAKHEAAPEWLKDAKLGIYFHWGPYSVPAYGNEWYPRWMHFENRKEYRHHVETYGKPSEFGYHDFVPMFTAEHFDAAEWAELFRKAGARFAGPVAEHHDGFSMWDSEITPWNAADKGPKQDILGKLFAELEKRDMKTIATFHHARNLQRYSDKPGEKGFGNSHYPWIEGQPPTSDDPELRLLYGNVPEEEWNETIWLGKLKEVIDNYQPDIIWFDSWLDRIPEIYRQRFAAYYLNEAEKWNKDVAIIRKQNDLPLTFSINDHEKSREPKALKELWMTDDTISTGSWCYTQDLKIKPLSTVIHAVIDTVAKNGVVLLNISPKADGTIPQDQRDVLLGLGAWLAKNGEAIYSTRPWINAAEGPTTEPEGGFAARKEFMALKYTEKDIRYTASKDGKTVYAIIMGVPEAGSEVLLKTFAEQKMTVKNVTVLDGGAVEWKMTENGLSISAAETDDAAAMVYKVEL
ncbi:alpha-L-fucosidase [Verrucomicrobia bacterium S94]|nr:alpha-L-fucosidase [Verrucomicrobia bacterium S94]